LKHAGYGASLIFMDARRVTTERRRADRVVHGYPLAPGADYCSKARSARILDRRSARPWLDA
jgi:hypothetical protein